MNKERSFKEVNYIILSISAMSKAIEITVVFSTSTIIRI